MLSNPFPSKGVGGWKERVISFSTRKAISGVGSVGWVGLSTRRAVSVGMSAERMRQYIRGRGWCKFAMVMKWPLCLSTFSQTGNTDGEKAVEERLTFGRILLDPQQHYNVSSIHPSRQLHILAVFELGHHLEMLGSTFVLATAEGKSGLGGRKRMSIYLILVNRLGSAGSVA